MAERSVSYDRTVCQLRQNGLSAMTERSVSQVRTRCQPYFLTLCAGHSDLFSTNTRASTWLQTATFVCASSHMCGSQDHHLQSAIISTNSCDARPCLGDKTTNHMTGFRQPSLVAWQSGENFLSERSQRCNECFAKGWHLAILMPSHCNTFFYPFSLLFCFPIWERGR